MSMEPLPNPELEYFKIAYIYLSALPILHPPPSLQK